MKIIKLNIEKKDFSDYSIKEWQEYFEKVFNNASLHSVLASSLTQSYLSEVMEEVKSVEVELGKHYDNLDVKPDLGNYEDVDWDSLCDEVKQNSLIHGVYGYHIWGHGDLDITCHSFKDVTVVWDMNNDTYDFYSTPEVLQVIDQWI